MATMDTFSTETELGRLREMRKFGGAAMTTGLADTVILDFLPDYPELAEAIERAHEAFLVLKTSHAEFLALDEDEQINQAHAGLTNFYAADAVNPYVALSAAGPWIVSLKGAVIYDCGGYGSRP